MDLKKSQRLLHKIQAFIDDGNGQELSRLEKDLIKSYVVQLYDAITSTEDTPVAQEHHKTIEQLIPKKLKEEPEVKYEPITHRVPEFTKPEITKPEFSKPEPPKREEKVEEEIVFSAYKSQIPKEKAVEVEIPQAELKYAPPKTESKPYEYQAPEIVKETIQPPKVSNATNQSETLTKLFDLQKTDDASRFSHIPIASIESAMGLNERIFTLNELFGGDKSLFDTTCATLNNLNSFSEAKHILMNGPAHDYKWADPERIKMAEHFIRLVARRYPKAGS
ncbi:MAG: hypothetical protein ABIQ11_09605 [Saprospiraceae bacterium]